MNIDEKYISRCLKLAQNGMGQVSPNPMVGAIVLDKNGKVVGEGWHKKYGEAHAEVNALALAGNKAKGGTIYVNLEPCSHYGKTPPCADLIIKSGIKRLVIGSLDPNPMVMGNGVKKCQNAGIEVVVGVLEDKCKKFNEIFFKNQIKKEVFTSIKTATTLDGKIATKNYSSKWITGPKSRNFVQKLRNIYDAVLTGSNTVICDNPSLTCRLKNGRNPIRIVVDSNLKLTPEYKVFNNDGVKVYVAILDDTSINTKYSDNVEFIKCPQINGKVNLNYLFSKLFEKGVRSVLVESGAGLTSALIKNNIADKLYLFSAPKIVGDKSAINWVETFDVNDINIAQKLELEAVKTINEDILATYYF